jgi:DNA uptake protein ComE-like DNA-binding protein
MLTASASGQTTAMPANPPARPTPAVPTAAPPVPEPLAPLVDINSASAAELGKVKFIGRKRAAQIIAGRPWKSPDDLVAKKVVPLKYYDKIKDRLIAQ